VHLENTDHEKFVKSAQNHFARQKTSLGTITEKVDEEDDLFNGRNKSKKERRST
jgi:hypothetical protein